MQRIRRKSSHRVRRRNRRDLVQRNEQRRRKCPRPRAISQRSHHPRSRVRSRPRIPAQRIQIHRHIRYAGIITRDRPVAIAIAAYVIEPVGGAPACVQRRACSRLDISETAAFLLEAQSPRRRRYSSSAAANTHERPQSAPARRGRFPSAPPRHPASPERSCS